MKGELIYRIPSDAWDAGNRLTHFYEACYRCGLCGGSGILEEEDGDIECPDCGGEGYIVIFE